MRARPNPPPCARCGKPVLGRGIYCSRRCSNVIAGARNKARAADDGTPRPIAWACGGGVDSTAIAALICRGELPPPAYAWIVDVGYEPSSTWSHVRGVLIPELSRVGVTLHVLRTVDYLANPLVEYGHCVLPAYRRCPDGHLAKLGTHCTGKWKAKVARRWLRSQGAATIEQWIGIAADEERRVRPSRYAWIRLRYPLVDRGLGRGACVALIQREGWAVPERTSCVVCPQHSSGEWRRLAARYPQDFARAVAYEREIQRQCPDIYLHRSGRPLDAAVNGCLQAGEEGGPSACEPSLFASCA